MVSSDWVRHGIRQQVLWPQRRTFWQWLTRSGPKFAPVCIEFSVYVKTNEPNVELNVAHPMVEITAVERTRG